MADDTDSVQISFTAQMESLQEGIQMGEDLIKEFAAEIATLQERITSLSEVGGDWAALGAIRQYTAGIQDVSAKTDILKDKLAELSAEQARLGVTQFKPTSLQYAIDETFRLNEAQSSAAASARVFQSSLGNVGISATEMAIQEQRAAAATDQLNRAQGSFYQSQAAGRAALQANLSALQGQSAAYAAAGAEARNYSSAASSTNSQITAGTSMFRLAAGAMGAFSIRTAGAARELIVLAHELASGRYSRIPGSLMVMGEMMVGLSVGAAALSLGFMAVVGAIGFFTYRAIELSNTVRNINMGAAFAGNADLSNQAIESTILEMAKMQGMTRATAEEVVSSFARMRGQTAQDLSALTTLTAEYSQATGESAKQSAEKLAAAIQNENLKFTDLVKLFPGLTALQLEHTQAIIESGNANERQAALERATQENLDKSKDAIIRKDAAMTSSATNFGRYMLAMYEGFSYEQVQTAIIKEQTDAWNKHAAAVRQDAEALAHRKLTPDQLRTSNDIDMSTIDSAGTRIKELNRSIANFNTEMATLPAGSDRYKELAKDAKLAQGEIDKLQHGQDKKMEYGTNLAGQEEIRATKELNAAVSADIKLSAEQQHDIIAANWRRLLDEGRLTKDQRVEVETEMNTAIGAAAKAGSALTIAQARNSIATINATERTGAAERLAAIVAVWAAVKDNDKLGYLQRLQAATEYENAKAALAHQQESVATAAARSDADTAIQISRIRLQAERETLTESFKLHQVSAQERTRLLQDLATREEELDEQELRHEMEVIGKGNAGYEEAANKIILIQERLKAEKSRIAAEEAAEDAQNARQSVTNWRRAVDEITSAENQMITGIIGGRETATQILGKMIDSFLTKELEADATYLTKHLLLSNQELAADRASEQAGLLYKSIFETQKTGVVVAAQSAQTAATTAGATARTAAENTGFFADIAHFVMRAGRWVASELGMTGATAAGVTARAGLQAGADATQMIALGKNAVLADSYAALSAVEAAASVAAIPFIGWSMAPEVAAEQYTAMQPFVTAAALDVGAWNVPHDMPAYIHKGESVIPQTFAEGLRTSGSLAGNTVTAKGGNISHLTYAPTINAPAAKSLGQHLASESSAMLEFIRSAQRDGKL